MFGNGKDCLAAKVNCGVLSTEGDVELAEVIAERFNALQGLDREAVAELPNLIEEGTLSLQNQKKLVERYAMVGLTLTKLRDAVKAASPDDEALPQPLLDAMQQADDLLAEIAKHDEKKEGSDE